MIRSVALGGLLATFAACSSPPTNPWAVKQWDEASLRAWSEKCAGTKRTVRDDTNGILSFTTSYEANDPRLAVAHCDIAWNTPKRRLFSVKVVIWHIKAGLYSDQYKLNYAEHLALVLPLVPPDVATLVRSIASGPAERIAKGPFLIDGGFDGLDRWHLKIELAND